MARRKNQPMSGSLKIALSMMKRIGRGLAAISSTASMKLTWLQTRSAAPAVGMFSSPRTLKR